MATSRLSLLCTVAVFASLNIFCSAGSSCTQQELNQEHLQKLAAANNELALNLYRKLSAESSENIFFSPLSISTAFGMLFYGARGNTAEELRSTLGYTKAEIPDDLVHATFRRFLSEVVKSGSSSDAYALDSANAILIDKHLEVFSQYKTDVEDLYQASIRDVDFHKSGEVVQDINSWVKDKTNSKITEFLDELDPTTVMVILNAVYFKGSWKVQFEPEKTFPERFYNNGLESQAKEVPLMHMKDRVRMAYFNDFQALELPYKGDNVSMVILLPQAQNGLSNLESTLTLDKFNGIFKQMHDMKAVVALPKFKAEFSGELSKEFKSLGASDIFSANSADFSGMSPKGNVAVSQILHKAVIEVNEEGSEAAAVTAVIHGRSGNLWFKADHPFLYFIVEKGSKSNMILFMGRINSM